MNALPSTKGAKQEAVFKTRYQFPAGFFDWVIADEAHVVRSGYAQADEYLPKLSGSAVRKLYATLNAAPQAKLLMLSATPFQNNVHELGQLISLVEAPKSDGIPLTKIINSGLHEFDSTMIEFKCDPLQIESRRLMDLYNGLNDDINSLVDFGDQVARPKRLQFGGHRNGLDDFLRDVMVRNRKPQVITQPLPVALSPLAKLQYLLLRDLVHEEGDGLKSMVSQKLCELVSSPEAFRRSSTGMKPIRQERYHAIQSLCKDNPLYEAKKDRLLDFVMNAKLPAEKRVIVIFCRYIPTLDHLSKAFKKLKQTNHVEHVYRMDGKTKVDSRGCTLRCIEARNRDRITIKPIIFLVSQVANEGLDFDRFSNTVVHFDGHYNPAIMDQRNGRVYRGKNTTGSIRSCQVILSDTYDQRIKFIELEKRKMKDFYLGDGELEPIFEAILESKQDIKRTILKRLTKFKLDLQPRVEWLLPSSQSELP